VRAEDLRGLELIGQDPETGFPLFGSARLMIMGMTPLSRLHKDLSRRLGRDGATKVFLRYGYEAGLGMATNLGGLYQWESPREWLLAGSVMRQAAGLAQEELEVDDFDPEAGALSFHGSWRDSFEALAWQGERGEASQPVCDILTGLASGYASAVLGREVWVRETSCQAQGAECCSFEGRPVDEWGMEPGEMRSFLALDSVEEEVERLKAALEEAGRELERHRAEVASLRSDRARQELEEGFILRSRAMKKVLELARKVASSSTTVLLLGETGTGKEMLARFLHRHSGRDGEPFLAVNCAALPPNLLESELFGHVKGAFTGADRDRQGLFVEAGAGTLFLDEVGELPLELQAKLLRALQEREVRPVGGARDRRVEARIVAASNRDLKEAVAGGGFREDLYYRLAVIPIQVPPLRQRREDVLPLARHFLGRYGPESPGFSAEAVRLMQAHPWPGNVRELENAMEFAGVLAGGQRVTPEHLPQDLGQEPDDPLAALAADLPTQAELVRRYTRLVLEHTEGHKGQAAAVLGIASNTLWRRLKAEQDEERPA
jgi:DNA-binding NtrC family response regulator